MPGAIQSHRRRAAWLQAGLAAGIASWAASAAAADLAARSDNVLEPIVVTAKKHAEPVPDAVLEREVGAALRDDPYFPDWHVNVRVKNGVVYLDGVVFDDSDVAHAKRVIRKMIPGVKRVYCDFYIPDGQ